MTKSEIGRAGETFCANHYKKLGYEIVGMNYHSRFGEIDVIAQNDNELVFIEVKTRKETDIVPPKESVGKAKQKKMMLTALCYLKDRDEDRNIRFDVFEVLHNGEKLCRFRMTESAFVFDEKLIKDVFY